MVEAPEVVVDPLEVLLLVPPAELLPPALPPAEAPPPLPPAALHTAVAPATIIESNIFFFILQFLASEVPVVYSW